MPHLSPLHSLTLTFFLVHLSMETMANTTVSSAADVAPEVAESISTGDQRLSDDGYEYEMTAEELAEFEARLMQDEADEAAQQQSAEAEQLPPVAPEAAIPAPVPETDTDLPAGLVARLKSKVTTMTTSSAHAAGNNPAVAPDSPSSSLQQMSHPTPLWLLSQHWPAPCHPPAGYQCRTRPTGSWER